MAGTRGDQLLGMGLEDLDGVERAGTQSRGIVGHAAGRQAVEARGIEAPLTDVLLQADPRRRHFGNRGEAQSGEVRQAEIRAWPGADNEKRIARHDIAEAFEVGAGLLVMGDHDAQRPAPHDIDLAGAQRAGGIGRAGRGLEHDLDAGLLERARGISGIKRGVEQGAEVF